MAACCRNNLSPMNSLRRLLNQSVSLSHSKSRHFVRRLSKSTSGEEYDYVVVGAGSAGCTVANRLVLNDSKTRVLVTEAGPAADQSWKIRMPLSWPYCSNDAKIDWCYTTTPQKHLNGRQVSWPRGKVLGGSSSLNAMMYLRGHAADYDRWAFKDGATGWSYAECLPYFIKSQNHELGASKYRGGSGYLKVTSGRSKNPLVDAYVEAGLQAGYPSTEDFNGSQQEGVGQYDFTINNGQRASTAAAFLRPAMKEAGSRLTVSADTLVHRVLFDGRRAVGVEYQTGGQGTPLKRAYASREVILSGGAVNSPQLLMLSGVGPADELRRHNIQLVHHSPGVGTNLQDHLRIDLHYNCTKPIAIDANMQLLHRLIPQAVSWFARSTGVFGSTAIQSGGFVRSRPDVEHPDVQLYLYPGTLGASGIRTSITHTFQPLVCTLRETSRGTITIKSSNPYDHPIIDPHYLETAEDLQDLRAAVKIIRQVIAQRAFDQYRGEEITPGKQCQSDSEIDAFVREKCTTIYHPSGTCRMGSPGNDDKVVVDPMCRVVGVEGLRVVDASVMPSIVSGNTNAPTIMIAEKVSDMILAKPPLSKADV